MFLYFVLKTYKGHKSVVYSISVDPSGEWLVSASNDKTVKCWEVSTGRCMNTWKFDSKVTYCQWIPAYNMSLIAISVDQTLIIVNPRVGDKVIASNTDSKLSTYRRSLIETENEMSKPSDDNQNENIDAGEDGEQENGSKKDKTNKGGSPVKWKFYENDKKGNTASDEYKIGHRIALKHQKPIKNITWHPKGDYFVTVLDDKNSNSAVIMHQLSRQKSVRPFAKMSGIVQQVVFHPTKPVLFVATQRYVKVYDLAKQILIKKLLTNVKWVSSLDIHPGGDNLIIGSFDSRLSWFDLDLSTKPYKTLKHHKKAIRSVAFHKRYPLIASASDDGTAIVSHGMVYE
jgi:ribosome biogenesis protein ERB1